MAEWRMAFRVGRNGFELWPICQQLGVAAIEYTPVDGLDLSAVDEPDWPRLSSPQKTNLRRFLNEMSEGDIIYVKQGPKIVGKGIVESPYFVDKVNRIRDHNAPWQHQRRVRWSDDFPEITIQIGKPQITTLVRLSDDDVKRVEQMAGGDIADSVRRPADDGAEDDRGGMRGRPADEGDIEGTKTEVVQCKNKRSRRLRNQAFKAARGVCSVCRRDYSTLLEGQGIRVLQVHHREQLSALDKPKFNTVDDLDVVCANCHLLLHLHPKSALTVENLQAMLEADGFFEREEL